MATRTPILNYQPGGGVPPGSNTGIQSPGFLYYWPTIENLTGGMPKTDLDAQNIFALPDDALIIVTIEGRGESQWLRVKHVAGTAVTDLNAGVIVPTNYDPVSRPYILHRQIGF
jgi:hypothetical protein